jgi:hypothetical protein
MRYESLLNMQSAKGSQITKMAKIVNSVQKVEAFERYNRKR